MFTGKPRVRGATSSGSLDARLQQSDADARRRTSSAGSTRVDRSVILRCLRPDPARRPKSALDVAAALPGGDPLAAALAAGETPSPEMVAGAREAGTLSRPVALSILGLFAAGLAAALFAANSSAVSIADPLPPQVLAHQAQAILDLDRPAGRPSGVGLHLQRARHPPLEKRAP